MPKADSQFGQRQFVNFANSKVFDFANNKVYDSANNKVYEFANNKVFDFANGGVFNFADGGGAVGVGCRLEVRLCQPGSEEAIKSYEPASARKNTKSIKM